MRYFHVYSDPRLGVREISEQEYVRLVNRKRFLVGWVDGKVVLFSKAGSYGVVHMSLAQLEAVVGLLEEEA